MRFLIAVFLAVIAYGEATRIIGGSDAIAGEFPHQLSMRHPYPYKETLHNCGAVLIALNKAITAAHCISVSNSVTHTVRAGTIDLNLCFTIADCQERVVTTYTRHPSFGYGDGNYPNDIGTLHFTALVPTDEVKVIRMDTGSSSLSDCQISGWGKSTLPGDIARRPMEGSALTSILQKASVTIMTRNECEVHWGSKINDGHICLWGDSERASCNGDSGGPLTCITSDGSPVVAGVTSWGVDQCSPSYPSVYSRITYFYDWIVDN